MHLTEPACFEPEARPAPTIKGNPRLGLAVVLGTCVPFWVAVAWWVLS